MSDNQRSSHMLIKGMKNLSRLSSEAGPAREKLNLEVVHRVKGDNFFNLLQPKGAF